MSAVLQHKLHASHLRLRNIPTLVTHCKQTVQIYRYKRNGRLCWPYLPPVLSPGPSVSWCQTSSSSSLLTENHYNLDIQAVVLYLHLFHRFGYLACVREVKTDYHNRSAQIPRQMEITNECEKPQASVAIEIANRRPIVILTRKLRKGTRIWTSQNVSRVTTKTTLNCCGLHRQGKWMYYGEGLRVKRNAQLGFTEAVYSETSIAPKGVLQNHHLSSCIWSKNRVPGRVLVGSTAAGSTNNAGATNFPPKKDRTNSLLSFQGDVLVVAVHCNVSPLAP